MSSHISPGRAFRVTRNKLSFLDHLPEVLAAGEPVERGTEKRFRDWLIRSHHEFDKCTRFSGLLPAKEQSRIRALLGDDSVVAFERAAGVLQSDPSATIAKGAICRVAPVGHAKQSLGVSWHSSSKEKLTRLFRLEGSKLPVARCSSAFRRCFLARRRR